MAPTVAPKSARLWANNGGRHRPDRADLSQIFADFLTVAVIAGQENGAEEDSNYLALGLELHVVVGDRERAKCPG